MQAEHEVNQILQICKLVLKKPITTIIKIFSEASKQIFEYFEVAVNKIYYLLNTNECIKVKKY